MTRKEAFDVVEAIDDYISARISWDEADAVSSGAGEIERARMAFEAARERLVDRLCGIEATDPMQLRLP